MFQTANVTLKVTKGHQWWCHSAGHRQFSVSLPLQMSIFSISV